MRPSFVFILADDLGYADLGCYGGRTPCSPVLDGMAAEGLRFSDGYANSSVCSPTRFALATGRWQHRLQGAADEPLVNNQIEIYRSISLEEIREVARKYLRPNQRLELKYLPEEPIQN